MTTYDAPRLFVRKLAKPNRWEVGSDPRVEVQYALLADIYVNVAVTVIARLEPYDVVDVMGTTGALPDPSVKAALGRLTVASYFRERTDENPPRTWKAVNALIAEQSPEARGIAAPYSSWNSQMARELWSQADAAINHADRYLFKQHSEARYDIDAVLRCFLDASIEPSELT